VHVANAIVQLERNVMKPPRLSFNQIRADITQYEWSDIKLEEYTHHGPCVMVSSCRKTHTYSVQVTPPRKNCLNNRKKKT
jgi:hypothetical protein